MRLRIKVEGKTMTMLSSTGSVQSRSDCLGTGQRAAATTPGIDPIPLYFRGGLSPLKAKRLERYIEQNIGEKIDNDVLAGLADLSVSHLSRAFKIIFGDSPHAYLIRRRIERAKTLMLQGEETLSQIAILCGFSDQAHLCRHFVRHAGLSPKRWLGEQLRSQVETNSANYGDSDWTKASPTPWSNISSAP